MRDTFSSYRKLNMLILMCSMTTPSNRHEEIFFWLHENEYDRRHRRGAFDIWNFAIFDDCAYGMDRYGRHFFESDYRTGITAQQCGKP